MRGGEVEDRVNKVIGRKRGRKRIRKMGKGMLRGRGRELRSVREMEGEW